MRHRTFLDQECYVILIKLQFLRVVLGMSLNSMGITKQIILKAVFGEV